MARHINDRPDRYYGSRQHYCEARAKLASDPKVQWFWLGTAQWFKALRAPSGRRLRFAQCPWKHPDFKY